MVTSFIIHAPLQSLLLPPSESDWYVCVIYTARYEKPSNSVQCGAFRGHKLESGGLFICFLVFGVTSPTSTELGEGKQDLRRQDCSNICGSSPKLFVWLKHFWLVAFLSGSLRNTLLSYITATKTIEKKSCKFDKTINKSKPKHTFTLLAHREAAKKKF